MEKDPDLYTYDNGRIKGRKIQVFGLKGESKYEWEYS